MVRRRPHYILPIALLLLLFSCAREYSFEHGLLSSGHLEKDQANVCQLIGVGGTYHAGRMLGDSNIVTTGVMVGSKGSFQINSDTINGYSFTAYGNFSDSGYFQVRLTASGTPVKPGKDLFTLRYDSSSCQFTVDVLPNSQPPGAAGYSLAGAPNGCARDSLWGGYVVGVMLDTSNHIDLNVKVTTAGQWSISTDTVDGYFFSGSGGFAFAGSQIVRLDGHGTPQHKGTDLFRVQAGASSCTFSANVEQVIQATNPDHFPLTQASFWNYLNNLNRTITDAATIGGNVYTVMTEKINADPPTLYYYRKSGADYFEYAPVDKYTISVSFVPQVLGDIHFLKEGLNTGDTWISGEYSGPTQSGQTILIQYRLTCVDNNATVVVNGIAFSNVYKISMIPEVRSVGGSYNGTGERYDIYYAKGVGIIYDLKTNMGYSQGVQQILSWQVN